MAPTAMEPGTASAGTAKLPAIRIGGTSLSGVLASSRLWSRRDSFSVSMSPRASTTRIMGPRDMYSFWERTSRPTRLMDSARNARAPSTGASGVGLSLVTRTVSTIRGACTCTEVTELSVASCACATPPPRQSDSAAAAKAAAPGNTNLFFTRTPRVMCSLARMVLRNYFAFSLTYQ